MLFSHSLNSKYIITPFLINLRYFCSSSSPSLYNIQDLQINNYLKENLLKNHIYQLKKFQYEALMAVSSGSHCFINSCTGSGKTLAYLIPVLSHILDQNKKNKEKGNKQREKLHGSLILTLNKQLCLQSYRIIRELDPNQTLSITRTGPISHYVPVVKQLSEPIKSQNQADLIDAKINNNLANILKWSKNDIVVSTPQLLYNLIDMTEAKGDIMMPQFVVIDQADLLLQIDKNVSRATFKLIQHVRNNVKAIPNSDNKRVPKFIISGSSFPNKIGKLPYKQALNKIFLGIKFIQGQFQHQIPPEIDLFSIQTQKMPQNKLFYLQDILKKKQNQRIIIFCNNKKSIQEVALLLYQNLQISYDVYHASLDSNQRSRVLHRFESGQNSILISTDLGSRGLDFKVPVNLIIEYEMAENVTGFLNRVGRTGRNKVKGQVITFVEPQNQQIFTHIQQLVSKNSKLDQVFSRKRSYSKLYKDKQI